ncbi:hypothetical protein WICPIJ_007838 [Wickerhamomyces pijperi]|uniref:Superoxide dismutase copper/zinc binding domain-containing protein n=1 Tax=Wickerhamomyces pijperi TaxID=599730 RepID=A0A9P8PZG7_WICPI|nr:hypothetical protein WICPIJ_007838 [Wickerhamomyces pijperi]
MLYQLLFVPALSLLASAAPAAPVAPKSLAPAILNNPTDVVLRADFPSGGAQTVVGVIQFYSVNGTAKVHVDVTGLPKNSGMFSYHIHDKPVGEEKTCETGAHFNPYGAVGVCDNQPDDSHCAVGDLSGKNGLINTTCFELFYYDQYLSLDPASTSYIGGKSINIHLIDTNQVLACGTIKPSREPEDLLLLNAETEAEEVRKFEELAGIVHSEPVVLSVAAISEEELAASGSSDVVEVVEVVEEDDEEEEAETEADAESEEEEQEEQEDVPEPKNLEELISEDLEELQKDIFIGNASNATNASFAGNASNVSGSEDDNESKASSLSTSLICAGIVAAVLSFFV